MEKYKMINLFEEILSILNAYGKKEEDIDFVIMNYFGEDIWFTWEDFKEKAEHLNYYEIEENDFVNPTIKIIGKGCWWIELGDQLFSFWELKEKPEKPDIYKKPETLRNEITGF